MITHIQRAEYERDGVICLRQVLSQRWLDLAYAGMQKSVDNPGRFFRDYTEDGSPARYIFEYWNWWNIAEFEDLAYQSPIAPIVAELIGAQSLHLLMDQWFLREAGSTNAATWHHDEPYFDFFGGQKAVVWFPIEPTTQAEGLTFLKGSHRWDQLFMAQNFGKKQDFEGDSTGYAAIEDFDQYQDQLVSYDLEPGDCLIFDFRTLHRATSDSTPLSKTGHRVSYRYGDQDVIFKSRGQWTEEISSFLKEGGQAENAPLDCQYIPKVYDRAS